MTLQFGPCHDLSDALNYLKFSIDFILQSNYDIIGETHFVSSYAYNNRQECTMKNEISVYTQHTKLNDNYT